MLLVLACGSRDWTDESIIHGALEHAWSLDPELTIIEGGARGADRIAGRWAAYRRKDGVGWLRIPADWDTHGKAAGPIRNQAMLDYLKDHEAQSLVLAFKDGFDHSLKYGGTEDMVKRASAAGVRCLLFQH